jgi:glycosyltransferase 2 family protein
VSRGAWLRLLVSFGISAVLLVLVLRAIDPGRIAGALSAAEWRLLPIAIVLYFAAVWIRSIRWRFLLPQQAVRTSTLFRTLVVGFTVNNVLPMRMGEVARVYLLGRWGEVPYGSTLASLVAERILDGLSLALLLLVALRLLPTPAPGYLVGIGVLAAAGFCVGGVLVAVAAWRSTAIVGATRWFTRPLPTRVRELAERLAGSFASELAFVRGAHRLGVILGLSVVAWCFELGLFYVLMLGFPLPASGPLAFLVGSAANFATLVPSSPGYVGTFDGALIKVLTDSAGVPVDPAVAGAYALVVHATLFLPVIILGTLVLWRSHVSFGQITHARHEATDQAGHGDWSAAA